MLRAAFGFMVIWLCADGLELQALAAAAKSLAILFLGLRMVPVLLGWPPREAVPGPLFGFLVARAAGRQRCPVPPPAACASVQPQQRLAPILTAATDPTSRPPQETP